MTRLLLALLSTALASSAQSPQSAQAAGRGTKPETDPGGYYVVAFPSGPITLHGVIYVPKGAGPFPALLYNHGSAPDTNNVAEALGPLFAQRGWVFFLPSRRGQGLSASAGFYIGKQINAAIEKDGIKAAAPTMMKLLQGEHLNDQLAALDWLRDQHFVATDRVATAGNSYGGIEAVLGADRANYCAAVDFSGGAESWANSPELQSMLERTVRNAHAPIFFIQPENDYAITLSHTLSAAMKLIGKPNEMKIYPPFGKNEEYGQSFAYKGASIWGDDVFRFLDQHCAAKQP